MPASSGGSAARPAEPPAAQGPEQTYFRYLAEGDWRVPRCRGCERVVFHPRVACPACGTQAFDWIAPAGTGTIHTSTTMRRPQEAGGDANLCLVDLDEGFRMMSRVVCDDPARPRIGERVRARLDHGADQPLVVFELAGAA